MPDMNELNKLLKRTMLTPHWSNGVSVCFKINDKLWMLAMPRNWVSFSVHPDAFYKFGFFSPVEKNEEYIRLAIDTINWLNENCMDYRIEDYAHCDLI